MTETEEDIPEILRKESLRNPLKAKEIGKLNAIGSRSVKPKMTTSHFLTDMIRQHHQAHLIRP